MSFADMMKKQNAGGGLAALQKKIAEKASQQGGGRDERFWKMPFDKDREVGSATVRILPWGMDQDKLFWVEWVEYSVKGKGGNYWNRSLRTLGEDDPMADLKNKWFDRINEMPKEQAEAEKKRAAMIKRQQKFAYNIVVVNNPADPTQNGKNFIWKVGPEVHGIVLETISPKYAEVKPIRVENFFEGANFHVRLRKDGKKFTYKDSKFDAPAPLHPEQSVLEGFWNGMHDLAELEGPDNYKSYEELEKLMVKCLGPAFIAEVTGEQFTPEMAAGAASSGANPFAQQPQQQTAPAQQNDPFASQPQQQAAQAQQNDPFANTASAQAQQNDPFANAAAPAQQNDPFASQPQQQAADPFAGNQSAPVQQNDPFANAAAPADTDNDPFANLGL